MNSYQNCDAHRRQSYANAIAAYDSGKNFPEQVFHGNWQKFLFFQSDYLFSSEFVDTVHDVLQQERANTVCLLNLGRTNVDDSESSASIYIDEEMNGESFMDRLVAGGPAGGWLFAVERYVCASDVGSWSIYCEKDSDIAVVALRASEDDKLECCFRHVFAEPITKLLEQGAPPRFPFSDLLPTWREGLLDNYGVCAR
ncbi:hypothetical protein BZM27_05610 [Paraburkholderia steynii]|uniref:Uncharacterized protein n=1 Tax=Paraburkholderia steynii TaxID=1245441 RepID=A0A4V2NHM9_9BURK|nr:hypothetical protein BZM27_05610 [Paraburkholderia steynii]